MHGRASNVPLALWRKVPRSTEQDKRSQASMLQNEKSLSKRSDSPSSGPLPEWSFFPALPPLVSVCSDPLHEWVPVRNDAPVHFGDEMRQSRLSHHRKGSLWIGPDAQSE